MSPKPYGITHALLGISNLCQIVMNIYLRRTNEAERRTLNAWRALKIQQDIRSSQTRQQAVTLNSNIKVRRFEAQNSQDNNKVVIQDLQIEMQKLKIMELQKKLGISTSDFLALDYTDPEQYCKDNGIKKR